MTEKEFHKMKSQDLVQLLLAQGIDSVRLQETLEEKKLNLEQLRQTNDSLKERLNERDAATEQLKKDLDQSDARIRALEAEMESLQADQWIDLKEIGSLTDATHRLEQILIFAQQEAEAYLSGEKPADPPPRHKIKKHGTKQEKHVNSKRKDTDKENKGKGLEESFCVIQGTTGDTQPKPQLEAPSPEGSPAAAGAQIANHPEKPDTAKASGPQAQAPQDPQEAQVQDPELSWPEDTASDPWPDEAPSRSGSGASGSEILQDPWPDEAPGFQEPDGNPPSGAADAASAEVPGTAAKPRKGLFGGFLQRKRYGKEAQEI
ncbi:MAG: hypothetical protein HFH40_12400 [Lachnospiraceae bacterium]|jgi:hypothetical protein|nr:hypothetical protein [Lachnospiraceae bacterium]